MDNRIPNLQNGYSPGHPWYYVLGGRVLYPKQILTRVRVSPYRGYRADEIERADRQGEPQRSESLRALRIEAMSSFRDNLCRYRQLTCELQAWRSEQNNLDEPECANIHSAISFKHNHLYNDFAHLNRIDDLLARQPDLFV